MTDKKKQKIRKAITKMMTLSTQMADCAEYAPVEFSLGNTGKTIQMLDNKSFVKVCKAFDIPEVKVRKSWNGKVLHKYADLDRGYELGVVLWEDEDGYEECSEEDEDA